MDCNLGLVGHWPFRGDCADRSPLGHQSVCHRVDADGAGPTGVPNTAATFRGDEACIEIRDHPELNLGTGDFTVAAWVRTDELTDLVGDLVSKFDPEARKGFQLSVVTNSGVTSTAQPNRRHLHFGLDDGQINSAWTDCGRPGNAVLVSALAGSQGALYAGTLEIGPDETGRLWRYEENGRWRDLGNPDGCNIVHSAVEFDGALYCGTGRYNTHGSLLGDIANTAAGGKVFRIDGDDRWTCAGHPGAEDATPESDPSLDPKSGKADDVTALTVFRGNLYCTSNHREGVFVYEGVDSWKCAGLNERVISLGVYRSHLYALINGGPVYRYEGGNDWSYCGRPGESRQTYACTVHQGRLYVGTWPQGRVYRYEGGETWAELPRQGWVGYECEVMAMASYNGKVYLGSLPMANVWRMDGERFTFIANLDASPVQLRRVWSMAVHEGKLFAGTLPSGHVYSLRAGQMATWDRVFPGGWHHVTALRRGGILAVYVDGREATTSAASSSQNLDLSNDLPLRIGYGPQDYFRGSMSDLRLYRRALSVGEIRDLARREADR